VQRQLDLLDGSALRLTVARYYTPTGRCIQKPYDPEQGFDDYYSESYHRYLNGEMTSKDSIPVNDSLKFITKGGKTVYGGGGIVPDVFVPINKDPKLSYYNNLVRQGLMFRYAFEFTDGHREDLREYPDFKAYQQKFEITPVVFEKFLAYAEQNGVAEDIRGIQYAESKIKTLLKAYIGRNLYDNEGFYPIFLTIDEDYEKAVVLFEEPSS
jgi:carboxyl-terminal processing protease